jgi:hypothetical protein
MAVAIHMKKTNRMNYQYRDFDTTNGWRLFLAWLKLKELPKFHICICGSLFRLLPPSVPFRRRTKAQSSRRISTTALTHTTPPHRYCLSNLQSLPLQSFSVSTFAFTEKVRSQ